MKGPPGSVQQNSLLLALQPFSLKKEEHTPKLQGGIFKRGSYSLQMYWSGMKAFQRGPGMFPSLRQHIISSLALGLFKLHSGHLEDEMGKTSPGNKDKNESHRPGPQNLRGGGWGARWGLVAPEKSLCWPSCYAVTLCSLWKETSLKYESISHHGSHFLNIFRLFSMLKTFWFHFSLFSLTPETYV